MASKVGCFQHSLWIWQLWAYMLMTRDRLIRARYMQVSVGAGSVLGMSPLRGSVHVFTSDFQSISHWVLVVGHKIQLNHSFHVIWLAIGWVLTVLRTEFVQCQLGVVVNYLILPIQPKIVGKMKCLVYPCAQPIFKLVGSPFLTNILYTEVTDPKIACPFDLTVCAHTRIVCTVQLY